jgi:uncharacterized membrane protein YphA (DoxX/SURF4 family)
VAAAFVALGTAKLLAVPSMRARAAHVGFSVTAYRRIGALELTGAAGLVLGVAVPPLRAAASVGLLVLLLGAVTAHLRAGDSAKGAAPAVVLAVLLAILLALTIGAL